MLEVLISSLNENAHGHNVDLECGQRHSRVQMFLLLSFVIKTLMIMIMNEFKVISKIMINDDEKGGKGGEESEGMFSNL